jgi:hypothetical protein
MRKLLVAALAVLMGCDSTSPRNVTLLASASASSIQVMQPVTITLMVTNGSEADIQVTGYACEKPFEVRNISQAVVGPAAPQVCSLELSAPMIIAPGGVGQLQTTWSGDSANGPADEIIYVSPGIYAIRPKLMIDGVVVYGNAIGIAVTQ